MPLKSPEQVDEPQLNLTPMIDIVFLLIIFFMVGAQFTQQERAYDIELPRTSDVQPLTGRPDEIVINVAGDGELRIGQQLVTREELETELVAARENFEDQAVVIRGEGQGRYEYVMAALSACHRARIRNVKLAYQLREDAGR